MYNLKIEKNEAVALTIFQVFQIVSATAPFYFMVLWNNGLFTSLGQKV